MKRADALVVIRVAGYHGDTKTFMRTWTENRVSYSVANAEFQRGKAMRAAGVPCSCPDCNKRSDHAN